MSFPFRERTAEGIGFRHRPVLPVSARGAQRLPGNGQGLSARGIGPAIVPGRKGRDGGGRARGRRRFSGMGSRRGVRPPPLRCGETRGTEGDDGGQIDRGRQDVLFLSRDAGRGPGEPGRGDLRPAPGGPAAGIPPGRRDDGSPALAPRGRGAREAGRGDPGAPVLLRPSRRRARRVETGRRLAGRGNGARDGEGAEGEDRPGGFQGAAGPGRVPRSEERRNVRRGRRPGRGAVPERAGGDAHRPQRGADPRPGARAARGDAAPVAPRDAALVRDASSGVRGGPARHPGDAGARLPLDDPAVRAGQREPPRARLRERASEGPGGAFE